MGLALRLWFVHLVQCKGPRMNQTTSKWIRCWFTLARTVHSNDCPNNYIITSHKGSYCLMYLNADLISWTGTAEWARVRGTGSSKHEANSYYEFVTRLSIPTLRLVNVPEFTSVFPALFRLLVPGHWVIRVYSRLLNFFHVISKSISVICPSRLSRLSRYWPVNNQMHRCYHDITYMS